MFGTQDSHETDAVKLSLPFYPSTAASPECVSTISSGAAHFLILASPSSRLFAIGDNRRGQLGVSQQRVTSSRDDPLLHLHRVEFFDGLNISQVATGAFHSIVLTEAGQVYFFGSDQKGQCGGTGGGSEPALDDTIEDPTGEEESESRGDNEDSNEVVQVCAFGESTMLRTKGGDLWVGGSSESALPPKSPFAVSDLACRQITLVNSASRGNRKKRSHPSRNTQLSAQGTATSTRNDSARLRTWSVRDGRLTSKWLPPEEARLQMQ